MKHSRSRKINPSEDKNQSVENDPNMTKMITLVGKDVKTVTIKTQQYK